MTIEPTTTEPLEIAIKKHLEQSQMPSFSNVLFDKIIVRINYERELKAMRPKLWLAGAGFLTALGLLTIAGEAFLRAFIQTPTSHYLSLMFTDFKLITTNWQDYALGILENLPLGSVSILLTSVLGSILLVDFAAQRFVKFRRATNLLHYGSQEKLV
jgi:hypothetical protein